jgi:NADPH:quinone reductase-like Zn-dependent oxidoreductase
VLAHKPEGLTFAEASTLPQAGPIALQATAGATAGHRVLVNGGGGGSGSFAIQLAKRAGAHVTGVDNAAKLDFMRSLGADDVIDHRTDDFTRGGLRYDLILDLVAHRSVLAYRRALAPGGRYRCVGGTTRALLRLATIAWLAGRLTRRRVGCSPCGRGRPTSSRSPSAASPATSRFTSTARSGSTTSPTRWRWSAPGGALGKVVVTPR